MPRARAVLASTVIGLAAGATIAAVRHRIKTPTRFDRNTQIAGDPDLAESLLQVLPHTDIPAMGISAVNGDEIRVATIGTPLASTFEIGSINKGITGMLYMDAIQRDEVIPSTTLGELFALDGAATADITLEELAQHRSGLPSQPMGILESVRVVFRLMQARNPFHGRTVKDLLDDLRRVTVGSKEPKYSNLGFAALGHALAIAAETDYPTLVQDRIAKPLGLAGFYVAVGGEQGLDQYAVQGRDSEGRAQQAWADMQYAPAGGIRADVTSMARFAQAILTGTAVGLEALEPTADFSIGGADRIGAGWVTSQLGERFVTWHNGGTGGFSSWLGLDREGDKALFLVGATTESLDEYGAYLLMNL